MAVSFITNDDEFTNGKSNNINDIDDIDEIDDIDFGIEEQNLAIIYDENVQLEQDEKINPFYVGINGGNLKTLQWGDIYRNYNSVIIMTLSSVINPSNLDKIFKYKIKTNELKDISGITYFRTNLNILKNKDQYLKTNIVNKNDLLELFSSSTFNESELVLGIFEMNDDNTRKYCDMYKLQEEVDDISVKIDMYQYYLKDRKLNNSLKDVFTNLKDNGYWNKKDNLQLNMTQTFIGREFNNQRTTSNKDFKVVSVRKENEVNYKTLKTGKAYNEYPLGNTPSEQNENKSIITHVSAKSNFVDPSVVIRGNKNSKKRTFYSSSMNKLSNDYISDIFNNLDNEKLKYDMLNNFMVSKDYCHLIVNNKDVLEKSADIFKKYSHVFKYTFGYSWLTFYLEECLARGKSQNSSRFTYDIHTANKLPVFPFTYSDIKQNPYVTVLIDDVEITQNNIFGLSFKENYDGYGVTDIETFKHRFNIFMSGSPDIDPLNGLDWSTFAVSGSTIPACLQKRSLLLDAFVSKAQDETIGFKNFINKYYNGSDVDLMSNETNLVKYLNNVNNVYSLLKTNLNASDSDMKYEFVKNFAVSITKFFFEDYLTDFNTTYGMNVTLEEFQKMSEEMIFKLYIYQKYIEVKNIMTKKILTPENIKNKFLTEYIIPYSYENMNIYFVDSDNYENYQLQDSEVIYYRNDFGKNLPQKENKMVIKFSESVRIKLFCKNTKIETFRIKDKDFFGAVARFHFPCVRAYYSGNNVNMLPSCITAMMTGLNIEYKYFAGIRNPVDIINKYLQRGFGVLLNKFEINLFLEYNKLLDDKHPLKYKDDTDKSVLLGSKNIKNKIYDIDCVNVDLGNFIETSAQLTTYYQKFAKNSCVDPLKMTTINKNGNINKFQPAYVQLCYDEMN
jgi:hypothetical protein